MVYQRQALEAAFDQRVWIAARPKLTGRAPTVKEAVATSAEIDYEDEFDESDIIEDFVVAVTEKEEVTIDKDLVEKLRADGAAKILGGRGKHKDKSWLEISASRGLVGYVKRSNDDFTKWLDSFEAAKVGLKPGVPLTSKEYSFTTEPVNMESIDSWLMMVGCRNLLLNNNLLLSDILISIKQRARLIEGKFQITVANWNCSTICELKGRSFTGYDATDSLLPEIAHEEHVAAHLRGLSTFSFPKAVRYICRAGMNIAELDLVNAYYQTIVAIFPEFDFNFVKNYVEHRAKWMEMGAQLYGVDANCLKKLFLRIGFLGSYRAWLKDNGLTCIAGDFSNFVRAFSVEMMQLSMHVKTVLPNFFAAAAEKKGVGTSDFKMREALAHMMFAVYMDKERTLCDQGMAAIPKSFSNEFDGFCAVTVDSEALVQKLNKITGFTWSVKPYPKDLLKFMQEKYSEQMWTKSALQIDLKDFISSRTTALASLQDGKANLHTMSFAKILACRLEGRVVVPLYNPKAVETFDLRSRNWTSQQKSGDGADDFSFLVKSGELNIFADMCCRTSVRCGKNSFTAQSLHDPLDQVSFVNSIAKEALNWLKLDARALDDPQHVRGQLLFSCGTLYSYKSNTCRRGEPEDRITRRVPHPFEWPAWIGDPEVQAALDPEDGLTATIIKLWACGGKSIEQALLGCNACVLKVHALKIQEFFDVICRKDRMMQALRDWSEDLDETVYHGENFARGAARDERATECTWLSGAAETGKDFFLNLVSGFADGPSGLLANLPYGYLTNVAGSRKEGPSAFLSGCEAAGFIVVSEVPNDVITLSTLKPLCEQRGAKVAVRDGYQFGLSKGGSGGFRPMGLAIITSNFPPQVQEKEAADGGGQTRVNHVTSKFVWSLHPKGVNQRKADPTVNQDALAGNFASSFFWFTTVMQPLLDHSTMNRKIGPVPLRIALLTELAFKCVAEDECRSPDFLFKCWLGALTFADSSDVASSMDVVHTHAIKNSVPKAYLNALITKSDMKLVQVMHKICYKIDDKFVVVPVSD